MKSRNKESYIYYNAVVFLLIQFRISYGFIDIITNHACYTNIFFSMIFG